MCFPLHKVKFSQLKNRLWGLDPADKSSCAECEKKVTFFDDEKKASLADAIKDYLSYLSNQQKKQVKLSRKTC